MGAALLEEEEALGLLSKPAEVVVRTQQWHTIPTQNGPAPTLGGRKGASILRRLPRVVPCPDLGPVEREARQTALGDCSLRRLQARRGHAPTAWECWDLPRWLGGLCPFASETIAGGISDARSGRGRRVVREYGKGCEPHGPRQPRARKGYSFVACESDSLSVSLVRRRCVPGEHVPGGSSRGEDVIVAGHGTSDRRRTRYEWRCVVEYLRSWERLVA